MRAGLASHHLEDEAIIVVTGDHGLRFALEFDSVGEPIRHGDLMFNVPLVIYAPALIQRRITLPWVTSHIDLAPTILDLLGIPRDGLLLQGENVLDSRLEERVTLLPSGMFVPMYPVDGFHYLGNVYSWAYVVDRVNVRADPGGAPERRAAGAVGRSGARAAHGEPAPARRHRRILPSPRRYRRGQPRRFAMMRSTVRFGSRRIMKNWSGAGVTV